MQHSYDQKQEETDSAQGTELAIEDLLDDATERTFFGIRKIINDSMSK